MDAIICVAESARRNFVSRYPQLAHKTHVIYNFFDVATIVERGREPFSFGKERFTMLSVGRMTEQKKYLRFLDVLARLKNDGYSFAWHVLGTGAEQNAILQKIDALGLANCVYLDGVTENPYKYMKNCDLFVLPSGWEGFPTVTVEAKILGCPVLATDVSGIREQLIHGETGWIVENSEDGIYEGLKHLLDNPDLVKKLKSNKGMENICSNDEKYNSLLKLWSK
jgi:glycosyltransferase involved in cell wall biosynthesis